MTGGGRGIGAQVAIGLAAAGARVAVLARSVAEVGQTVAVATAHAGSALAVPADVTRPEEVSDVLATIAERWGPVEVLVNNAGAVRPLGPSAEVDLDGWAATLDLNVTAVARLSFAVLPPMLAAGWGRIVNVSSSVAAQPAGMTRANAYATSKAALEAHTVNLAAELAGTGVTVNAYRPGSVDTAMQAWIRDQEPGQIGVELHRRFMANFEQGRLLSTEESAASLLALLPGVGSGEIWHAYAT